MAILDRDAPVDDLPDEEYAAPVDDLEEELAGERSVMVVGNDVDGYVYFIEATGLNRIKIGQAACPKKRLTELQTGSPVVLKIVAVIPSFDGFEKYLHRLFAQYRVCGEWFSMNPGLQRLIDAAPTFWTADAVWMGKFKNKEHGEQPHV